jgi:hypothetical protein
MQVCRFLDSLQAGTVITIKDYLPACVAIRATPNKMKNTPAQLVKVVVSFRKTLENIIVQMYDVAIMG